MRRASLNSGRSTSRARSSNARASPFRARSSRVSLASLNASSLRAVRSRSGVFVESRLVDDVKKKVVVIGEDDEPIATLLRDAINDEPAYQAVVVSDGALVLETVRQVHADLLILDIMMPGLNGLEVYDRVREDATIRDMPVLFVSANVPQFDREFKARKITAVLTKPFDL